MFVFRKIKKHIEIKIIHQSYNITLTDGIKHIPLQK